MSFYTESAIKIPKKKIRYLKDENSIIMEPPNLYGEYSLEINDISLNVLYGKVNHFSGYFQPNNWIEYPIQPPKGPKGNLLVKGDFRDGISYSIQEETAPVYCNSETHWICVGDPVAKGDCVEFIRNCKAVVNEGHNLKALWFRLNVLPDGTCNILPEDDEEWVEEEDRYGSSQDDVTFAVNWDKSSIRKKLLFEPRDASITTEPCLRYTDFVIPFNELFLSVVGNIVVDIVGNILRHKFQIHRKETPQAVKGELIIAKEQSEAQFVAMSQYKWPIFYNPETDWICIGDPKMEATAVEFIRDCIAVLNSDGFLYSLWLKPIGIDK